METVGLLVPARYMKLFSTFGLLSCKNYPSVVFRDVHVLLLITFYSGYFLIINFIQYEYVYIFLIA
jgi:hypothetical protein